jgi:hypothetical protein
LILRNLRSIRRSVRRGAILAGGTSGGSWIGASWLVIDASALTKRLTAFRR